MNIEFFRLPACKQCQKTFELRNLNNNDDYYSKYEEDYCPPCGLSLLSKDGIKRFSFLRDAVIIGYSLEDISAYPELRYIEIKLTNGSTLKIKVRDTRWLPDQPH